MNNKSNKQLSEYYPKELIEPPFSDDEWNKLVTLYRDKQYNLFYLKIVELANINNKHLSNYDEIILESTARLANIPQEIICDDEGSIISEAIQVYNTLVSLKVAGFHNKRF